MTEVGTVYGEALYGLCQDEGISEALLKELDALEQCFRDTPEFIRLLSSPALTKAERCTILDDSFRGKLQPYLLNFLKILTQKGYMRHFVDCCGAYRDCYNRDHNILPVKATTASALTKEQTQRLTEKLSAITGKTIALTNHLDPDVLGGVRLSYDGKQLDDTIANRLDSIRSLLKNTVL
ncbi:MAG: ATP synthase F1 subunit delta [Oscillospiraceae bacterium]|nr:ATP synthase F1 subunit delta [Oscillospiraceae bacterium]